MGGKEKMALYFVTMDLEPDAMPRLSVGRLASILRAAISPYVETLLPLREDERLLAGGYLVGEGQMVFVFEADSEEEVRGVLEDLPLSEVATTTVRPMRALGELSALDEF
jgi:muconolactone delta-isomerase